MPDLPDLPDDVRIPDHIGAITDRDEDLLPSQSGSVQIISSISPLPGSPYIVEVWASDDVAIALPRDKAVAYAMAVWTAAMQAVYFAGIRAQMRDVFAGRGRRPGGPDDAETVDWMVDSFVQEVLPPDHEVTAPLKFEPGCRRSTGEPLVRVTCNGEQIAAWSPDSARHHARSVLDATVAADLDTAYRTYAVGAIGVEEQRGRAMVHDLGSYLRHFDDPDPEQDRPEQGRPKVPGPPPGARPAGGKKRRRR